MSKQITCDGLDITEQVAALFDALVGSMDWGSDFLDEDTVEAALIVADIVGYAPPNPPAHKAFDAGDPDPGPPPGERWGFSQERVDWHKRAEERFRSQMRAKVAARIAEMRGEV
jgi:hypothetical protein